MARDLSTTRATVFGDPEPGTACRICGRSVDDGRRKVCSDYCDAIQRAVMGWLNWDSIRRRILTRDDETCQSCGWDRSIRRRARDHVRGLIAEAAGEKPDGISALRLGRDEIDADERERRREQFREWRERRDAAKARYGDPEREFGRSLHVDHIEPVADGGHPFDPGNLQTLCDRCHERKTAAENSQRASTPTRDELNRELSAFIGGDGDE